MTRNYYLEHIDGLDKRITALRKQKGMLKNQLAKSIGVSFSALNQWEKGQHMPTWNNAVKHLMAHKRALANKNATRGNYFGYIEGLGDRIYHLRKKARLTQCQLAERIGVSYRAISAYESNRVSPSSKVAQKLADALGISLVELLGKGIDHAENHGNHD